MAQATRKRLWGSIILLSVWTLSPQVVTAAPPASVASLQVESFLRLGDLLGSNAFRGRLYSPLLGVLDVRISISNERISGRVGVINRGVRSSRRTYYQVEGPLIRRSRTAFAMVSLPSVVNISPPRAVLLEFGLKKGALGHIRHYSSGGHRGIPCYRRNAVSNLVRYGAKTADFLRPLRSVVATQTCRLLRISVDTDAELSAKLGTNTRGFIRSAFDATKKIFRSDLSIVPQLLSQNTYQTKSPYSSSLAPILLEEFRRYTLTKKQLDMRSDAFHMVSGKNFDGSTIGLAYLGGICGEGDTRFSISQFVNPAAIPLIMAHELGHGLGADHDKKNEGIMASVISPTRKSFSQASRTEIKRYLAVYPHCLSAVQCR